MKIYGRFIMGPMKENSPINLEITIDKSNLDSFWAILSSGIHTRVNRGDTVFDFLMNTIGPNEQFIEENIQTIFLNNKVVDDIKKAQLNPDAVLALSAAMPGLVGATLRTSGPLKAFRDEISYHNKEIKPQTEQQSFIITIKLFNLVTKQIGDLFLKNGIILSGMELKEYILNENVDFWDECITIKINNETVKPNKIKKYNWKDQKIFLRVIIHHQ